MSLCLMYLNLFYKSKNQVSKEHIEISLHIRICIPECPDPSTLLSVTYVLFFGIIFHIPSFLL